MRLYYLDNLRWIIILLLFPYHTFLIYTTPAIIGSSHYMMSSTSNMVANIFILFVSFWFMQLLFAVAGIATFYSLKKEVQIFILKKECQDF